MQLVWTLSLGVGMAQAGIKPDSTRWAGRRQTEFSRAKPARELETLRRARRTPGGAGGARRIPPPPH
jgi:hypothetical protein